MSEVSLERKGINLRFKLDKFIPKDDFFKIIGIPDVWYYKETKHYYLKPHRETEVRKVLIGLGFTVKQEVKQVTSTPQNSTPKIKASQEVKNGNSNGTEFSKSQSKVLSSDFKVISKMSKVFNIKSFRMCNYNNECSLKVFWNNAYICPKHKARRTKSTRKVWYVTGLFDIEGDEQLILLFDTAFAKLLHKIKMKKSDLTDAIKGLKGSLYWEQLRQIKEKIVERLKDLNKEYGFVGELIEWKKNGQTIVFFKATDMMTEQQLKHYKNIDKFIKGELVTIQNIADEILPDYKLKIKYYGDIPVITLNKQIGNDTITINVRAPIENYGKAYHIWMKINGTHMFPSEPVVIKVWGHTVEKWAWRIFHTKGWEDNLKTRLKYAKGLEEKALVITNKLKEIQKFDTTVLLSELNLSDKEKKQITSLWEGGNLLDFIELIGRYNATEGLGAFKKAILILYKVDYPRWLIQEIDLKEEDLKILENIESGRILDVE